ncbi:hypothetical protein [Oerskovia jenensis]|uniref:hypothetical protein n=1 Tax=Oerskovia jenensis TaxID=162169 RepID=UPI0036DEBD90
MTDDKERPGPAGDQDPTEAIKPAFPAPGGITGGSVPPAEPIPNAADPFSPTGASTTPGGPTEPPGNRAWWWALGGLVLLAIVAVSIWLATRGDADGDAERAAQTDPVVVVAQETSRGDLVAGGSDPGGPVEPQG